MCLLSLVPVFLKPVGFWCMEVYRKGVAALRALTFFLNLGFPTAEASMFKLREKIASNERSDRHLR
jgi:hypothetical protein